MLYNLSDPEDLGNLTFSLNYGSGGDYDTAMIPYPGNLKHQALWERVVKIVFYSLIISVAVVGNLMVVAMVIRNKKLWTTTNFYIVNLAVSDLMVTLSCTWVTLVDDLSEGWILGAFFCRVNSFAQGKKPIYTWKLIGAVALRPPHNNYRIIIIK